MRLPAARPLRSLYGLAVATYEAWHKTHASFMAAALAFYSLISVAPLSLLLLFIAGSVLGPEEVQLQVQRGLRGIFGPQGADLLRGLIGAAYLQGQRWIASMIGIALVAYGAARVFAELQRALRAIWHDPEQPPTYSGPVSWMRTHALSFLMVVGVGVLWFLGLVGSTTISAFGAWVGDRVPANLRLASVTHVVVSVALLTPTVSLVYRYLPERRVRWRYATAGALFTAVLLTVGQKLIGIYLGHKTVSSVYGAAGSIVLLLFWFYYSWLVFFMGAVLTRVYAIRSGGWPRGARTRRRKP